MTIGIPAVSSNYTCPWDNLADHNIIIDVKDWNYFQRSNGSGDTSIVPTRDSERWIGQFLKAYRAIGIKPLYIVDSRIRDRTEAVLRDAGADIRLFEPGGDFVEFGMPAFASQMVSEDWIYRLDDDEFPSAGLLRWVQEIGCQSNRTAWHLSRRELFRKNERVVYSRLWSQFYTVSDPTYLNAQLRLYRHRDVDYCNEIHTPGFRLPQENTGYAPQDLYFIHCDVLLRSAEERLEKLRRYERLRPGSSWKFGYNYLPELLADDEHPAAPIGTGEFDSLLASFPQPAQTQHVALIPSEIDALQSAISGFRRELETGPRRARIMNHWLATKPIAWVLCALAKILYPLEHCVSRRSPLSHRLQELGTDIWYCADVRRSRRKLTWHRRAPAACKLNPADS